MHAIQKSNDSKKKIEQIKDRIGGHKNVCCIELHPEVT